MVHCYGSQFEHHCYVHSHVSLSLPLSKPRSATWTNLPFTWRSDARSSIQIRYTPLNNESILENTGHRARQYIFLQCGSYLYTALDDCYATIIIKYQVVAFNLTRFEPQKKMKAVLAQPVIYIYTSNRYSNNDPTFCKDIYRVSSPTLSHSISSKSPKPNQAIQSIGGRLCQLPEEKPRKKYSMGMGWFKQFCEWCTNCIYIYT